MHIHSALLLKMVVRWGVTSKRFSRQEDGARFLFLSIRRNGVIFHIRIFPSGFRRSNEAYSTCLRYFAVFDDTDGRPGFQAGVAEAYEWFVKPFVGLLAELAPRPPGRRSEIRFTLHQHMNAPFCCFDFNVVDEHVMPSRTFPSAPPDHHIFYWKDGGDFVRDMKGHTRFYLPQTVLLKYDRPEDALFQEPQRVLVDGGEVECYFKRVRTGAATRRELRAYQIIREEMLHDESINICRLKGVVAEEDDTVLGLLLTHVDGPARPLSLMISPNDNVNPSFTDRCKWHNQISDILLKLHNKGIAWGGVHPDNVLIDAKRNAWVVDFANSFTAGWADPRMSGRVESDNMAMAQIYTFLFPWLHAQSAAEEYLREREETL